jgi:LDH2 family malate/lactate/ureidoglycolate dehydrogenase
MRGWIAAYKKASGAEGRYPGERAGELERKRQSEGIPLEASVMAELKQVGELSGARFDVAGG